MVPKNVRDKKGGGYHDFLSKLFCLTVPKNFVGEPFCASQAFQYRKTLWIRGRGEGGREYHNFLSKTLSHIAEKNRRGTPLCCVSENFRQRKCLWIRRGEYQDFPSKIFLSQSAQKIRRGTL